MAAELQPGDPRKVGPYWLQGRLGSGGMGRVFLGLSPGGRQVAVKVVRAELAEQADFRARFAREVAAAQTVSGLFTAPVVDADLDGPVPWLATAYVAGPSLADAVTGHGPLPVTSVLALAAGLAEGLGAIHAAGIVHRDLKPSNVLLAEDGPRIIDFGISRAAEASALTGTGLVVGSPGFMSPEQAEGRDIGPPSDVFSLGAVLTFAATGDGPFGTGSTATLAYRVVHTPPATGDLPAELRPLVERCLAKDPEQRPTTRQLLAELDAAHPAAGWLPAPITQAFPFYAPPDPAPAGAAADGPPDRPATELAAPSPPPPPDAPGGPSTVTTAPARAPDAAAARRRARQGWRGRLSRNAIIVILALAVLGLATSVALLIFPGNSAGRAVALQPVTVPGANPFMPPAGTDKSRTTPPVGARGTFQGDTAGLYGGSRNGRVCDPQKMIDFLATHPDKAAAWATVLGIRPEAIPAYVAGLTPVILRSDVLVTNHGFKDGYATTVPAVLEAGTAVLVDRYGTPVTKCFCGNPLTRPTAYAHPHYTGTPWQGFSAANLTIIRPSPVVINSFTLIDLETGTSFQQPGGASVGSPTASASPTTSPTPPASPTTSPTPPASPTTSPTPPASLGPGIYQVNRQFYDDGSLILALDRVQISQQGRAVFYVIYRNIGSSPQVLTCVGNSNLALAALTLADGQVINSVETYCSDHPNLQNISVAPGQALTSYAIFPSTKGLSQPFSFSWYGFGTVPGLKLPSPTG